MQPILEIKKLRITAKEKTLVKNVSFDLYSGECLALIGESGSGKTTLAQTILHLQSQTLKATGEILYYGRNLLECSTKEMESIRAKKIAMIFQDPATSLNPTMQIGKQLIEALEWISKVSKFKALELLDLVGIDKPELRVKQYPHQLSGGMLQRVMIAMALACNPQILIADEPTSALDATTQFQILMLLKDLQKKSNLSILFITHDLDAMAQFCDRALIMRSGEIVEEGSIKKLFLTPQHIYTKALLEASYVN